jgi:hypothetical protein
MDNPTFFPPYSDISENDVVEYKNKKWIYVLSSSQGAGTSGGILAEKQGWYKLFDGRSQDTSLSDTKFRPIEPVMQSGDDVYNADGTRTIKHFLDLAEIPTLNPPTP